MNGADKYLEYQYQHSGSFYECLFKTIAAADEYNLAKLSEGFPEEVEAYKTWTRIGVEAFSKLCHPQHPLLKRLQEDYALLPKHP